MSAVQRIADFIAGIDGKTKRRAWQRHIDALPIDATSHWNDLLSALPEDAWIALRTSTLQQIDQRDPMRGWLQAQDRFNEVHAFVHLQKIGCTDIRFESTSTIQRRPDLIAHLQEMTVACEVKTLNVARNTYLRSQFRTKIRERIADATKQLMLDDVFSGIRRIIYLVVVCEAEAERHEICRLVVAVARSCKARGAEVILELVVRSPLSLQVRR